MDLCLESGRLLGGLTGPARTSLAAALLCALLASPLSGEMVAIRHQAVNCLVAGQYPQIDACFSPADRLARARVYFHGADTRDWYYVEMKPEGECFRGVLPRPRKSLSAVHYYVAATDREFAEARTEEYAPVVVSGESECREGLVAPVVSSATVVVGALSGAAVPAGFVGGGLLGLGVSTAAVAGVVGAGVTGAVIVGGGDSEPTTTTVPPRPTPTPGPTPTTGPTPAPVPTPTPEPTPDPGPCLADDSDSPEIRILAPSDNAEVGAVVEIEVEATDPGPVSSGIDVVVITADEQGGSRSDTIATFHEPGPLVRASWTVPPCMGPQDRWYIDVRALDHCLRVASERVRVKRTAASCASPAAADPPDATFVWTSELSVPEGRGQVIVNGTQVVFPGPGRGELLLSARAGRNRLEATLVSARGGGLWRFSLAAGGIGAGSLRVSAGDVAAIGPDAVSFRLAGRPGERVVFTFDVEPALPGTDHARSP